MNLVGFFSKCAIDQITKIHPKILTYYIKIITDINSCMHFSNIRLKNLVKAVTRGELPPK